jgi:hypothetical protein
MSEPAKDEAELVKQIATDVQRSIRDGAKFDAIAVSALAAIREAGWAVVPVEPTWPMVRRGGDADIDWRGVAEDKMLSDVEVMRIYRAMLAAAPGVKP